MKTRHCGAKAAGAASLALLWLSTGCLERELKPLNPCLVSSVSRQVKIKNVDKVDLLFVVDNSNSMAGEQASLREQFPNVIKVLTTGKRSADDPNPFPPVKDLHVGVVSSDMGVPGVPDFDNGKCRSDGGDDGRLQNTGRLPGCDAQYPQWLSYTKDPSATTISDPTQFAQSVGCVATLGTLGCGFEQQLEAPFKALWPANYVDASGKVVSPNPFNFLSTSQAGTKGRGDLPPAQGGNLGFLRNDPGELSLIAIVVVTDEEDCSVFNTEHLNPAPPAGSKYLEEKDINLRCFNHPEFNYDVVERYYKGFRMLRPGNEELVVFAAITGVPEQLVTRDKLPDFNDEAARNAFYDTILNDPKMQQKPDDKLGTGFGNLQPSCSREIPGDTQPSNAYPPRRIVQLAKEFGPNGIVQSICQDDFGPAMEAIIEIIAKQLGNVCLPRKLVRQNDGTVACNVVWELPAQAPSGSGTPTRCDDKPFLEQVDQGRTTTNAAGGQNCKVKQIPIDPENTQVPAGDASGWYYDDFSTDMKETCTSNQLQRVAFTDNATPPTGVTVKLECLNETQRLPNTDPRIAPDQPEIGSPCGSDVVDSTVSGDEACIISMSDGSAPDTRMFCHPSQNVCVRSCGSSTQCPAAWVCDTEAERPYCVNPTCGADTTGGTSD